MFKEMGSGVEARRESEGTLLEVSVSVCSRQPPDKLFTNTPLLFELVESGRLDLGRTGDEREASERGH